MPLLSYLTGSRAERDVLERSFASLYNRPGLKVVGSYGRIAMYGNYGWKPFAKLPIAIGRNYDQSPVYRNINVITPGPRSTVPRGTAPTYGIGTPEIDTRFNRFFKREGSGHAILGPKGEEYPIAQRVLEGRTRRLDDMALRTLTVGAHLALENLVEAAQWDERERSRHAGARQEFREFAETVREQFPKEFLPEDAYEPFRLATAAFIRARMTHP